MKSGDIIKFNTKKNFTYIKPLGIGGTGDTHLFKDETTDILFAIKKYVPKDACFIDELYKRFVDEIKILFNISHPNIVRIYNYYLYPDLKTGYLQMEYIDGISIDKFESDISGKNWNDIFREVISAFEYLENNNILHRDIRPSNILIDNNNCVKIIDFGFGKQLNDTSKEDNSVFLNWPATVMPNELNSNFEYDKQTEIYFVGILFKNLLENYKGNFEFSHILDEMTKVNPIQRSKSFSQISKDISSGILGEINFNNNEKEVYQIFAEHLSNSIVCYINTYLPINNITETLSKLSTLIKNSSLENFIQDNSQLIRCFLNGSYRYKQVKNIEVENVINFYNLVTSLPQTKQKILFDNIYNRLSTIKISIEDTELPF